MLSNLVALLSSRVFVGYPLNRNEAWVRADPCLSDLLIYDELRSLGPRLVILWMALEVRLLEVLCLISTFARSSFSRDGNYPRGLLVAETS